ncbi:MAG: DUF2764 family protein [Lentisphaerae bacterium]|nr:MAG: DUF2764 family protein [Lentisphaerota bacterium]
MAKQFYYLISSLPTLQLGGNLPWRSDAFLEYARYHLTPSEWEALASVSLIPDAEEGVCRLHSRWLAFERNLRNLLVRMRASRQKREAQEFLRRDLDLFGGLEAVVQEVANMNPLQAEEILDRQRWLFLDQETVGHEFDFNSLVAYRLKLSLLEKRAGIDEESGNRALDDLRREQLNLEELPEFIHG